MICTSKNLEAIGAPFLKLSDRSLRNVRVWELCQISNVGLKSFPTLTNFNFIPASIAGQSQAVATWDTPPVGAGATATELWTSPDNITFTLNSTWAAPQAGGFIAAPAVGSFMWAKARWISPTTKGGFGPVLEVSGRVCDWAKRVTDNGGAFTTVTERTAANAFDLALVSAGIDSLMITNQLFISSSLIGAITPLYHLKGTDPWTNHNFVGGDLTVNGLLGDGATKYLDPGIFADDMPALGDGGSTVYNFTSTASAVVEFGGVNASAQGFMHEVNNTGAPGFYGIMWDNQPAGHVNAANAGWTGYTSLNRTAANSLTAYKASSTVPHAVLVTNGTATAFDRNHVNIFAFAWNNNGAVAGWTDRRLSYLALHHGLTQAQSLSHYNAIQAFLTAKGGGFV